VLTAQFSCRLPSTSLERHQQRVEGTRRNPERIKEMTDLQHLPATSTESDGDYQITVRAQAPASAVFRALTTAAEITAWWNPGRGSGETGGELVLPMGPADPLIIRVDKATPALVQWTVISCPFEPDWLGTRPRFTITQVSQNETEIQFRHIGLTPELECIDMCTRSWNHFLPSLRLYLETGAGQPRGSEADLAWRREAYGPDAR
jgi:uncharacterized protein YndB with AHSA1/START domain